MPAEKLLTLPVDNLVENAPEGGHYLDTYAKVSNISKNNELEQKKLKELVSKFLFWSGHTKEANRITNCGQNWVPFSDTAGHMIYSRITCNLPFCPTCGKSGSALNKRRANRVKDVLLGFGFVGHFVFTLPKDLSAALPDSKQINQLFKLAWQSLRDWLGAEAAVIALHFCGDKKNGLHLHFDCSFPIVNSGGDCSFPIGLLNMARSEWTQGVNRIFKTAYLDSVGHYNFVTTLEQQHHLIKYVTRSTIPAEKFIELADEQKVYCIKMNKKKIIRYFGEFVGKKKAVFLAKYRTTVERDRGELVDQKICPICNEKMRPSKPVFMDDIPLMNVVNYNGYTLVDKEIAAYLRQQEAQKSRSSPGFLVEIVQSSVRWLDDQLKDLEIEEG
jgi:hypothetical protein